MQTKTSKQREASATDRASGSCAPVSCSADLQLAEELEMSALQHADNGDADYGKPIMAASIAIKKLVAALDDANGLCRSAYQIADRMGGQTNWPAFKEQLNQSLKRQHEIMYPPNDPSSATGAGHNQSKAK